MSPRKLTESEKVDILKTYRETPETTSTLASRYSVSNSTISRLLKARLPASEYETLVQQKRAAAGKGKMPLESSLERDGEEGEGWEETEGRSPSDGAGGSPLPTIAPPILTNLAAEAPHLPTPPKLPQVRSRQEKLPAPVLNPLIPGLDLPGTDSEFDDSDGEEEEYFAQASTLRELLGEDLEEEDEDDLDDEEDLEEGFYEMARLSLGGGIPTQIEVLPLSKAELPRICYLVIDRGAELITRPLKEFGELGQIPAAEVGERTLPVFDNHRVARRFSRRSQRVIKVPDSRMLPKTSPYLYAKGITRLLFDGQVYSLDDH